MHWVTPRASDHTSLGQRPRNRCEKTHSRAPTARFIGPPPRTTRLPRTPWSIPHVTFIEFDVVLAQQLAIFLLEGFCPMMLLLRVDVMNQAIQLAESHREI